jgi:hypothetical protein
MNIVNCKAKVLPANYHKKYLPAIAVDEVLRTNHPFVVQSVKHKNATNAHVCLVGTKLFAIGEKFSFLASPGVRGTNAQNYGYGGNVSADCTGAAKALKLAFLQDTEEGNLSFGG